MVAVLVVMVVCCGGDHGGVECAVVLIYVISEITIFQYLYNNNQFLKYEQDVRIFHTTLKYQLI